MLFFSRLTTRTRLCLMLLFPMMGLTYFSITSAISAFNTKEDAAYLGKTMNVSVAAGTLIHELQKERGMSAGFIGSRGSKFGPELAEQRKKTDAELANLSSMSAVSSLAMLKSALQALNNLATVRGELVGLKMEGKSSFGYYTQAIDGLMDAIADGIKATPNQEAMRSGMAYLEFVRGKEFAGRERATLNAALAANRADPEVFRRFIQITTSQNSHFDSFKKMTSNDVAQLFGQIETSDEAKEVARIREVFFDHAAEGNFRVEPGHWFATITKKIDAMKSLETRLAGDLIGLGEHVADEAAVLFWTNLVILVTAFVVALIVGFAITRSLTRDLGAEPSYVRKVANEIAAGNLVVEINGLPHQGTSLLPAVLHQPERTEQGRRAGHVDAVGALGAPALLARHDDSV